MMTDLLSRDGIAGSRTAGAQTVEKAMHVLLTVADQPEPVSLVALSRAAGIEKTATHRIVTSLVRYGILHFEPETRTYSLGLRLVELGQRALARMDIVRQTRPFLERLGERSGEAVHLGVFEDGQVVFVAQVPSTQPVVIRARVGSRVPAHCTAAGKCLLAFDSGQRLAMVRAHFGLSALTPNTITDPDQVLEHLERVRRLGYAIDDEEHRLGVRCVGAPIRDASGTAIGGVSITGPAFRFSRELLNEMIAPLLEATGTLSAALGFREDETPRMHSGPDRG